MRKIILQLVLLVIPMSAFADDTHPKDTIAYDQFFFEMNLETKTAKTLYAPLWPYYPENIVITSEIPHKGEIFKVTEIGDQTFYGYKTSIKTVTIPNTVTYIGEYNQEIKGKMNVEIIPVSA